MVCLVLRRIHHLVMALSYWRYTLYEYIVCYDHKIIYQDLYIIKCVFPMHFDQFYTWFKIQCLSHEQEKDMNFNDFATHVGTLKNWTGQFQTQYTSNDYIIAIKHKSVKSINSHAYVHLIIQDQILQNTRCHPPAISNFIYQYSMHVYRTFTVTVIACLILFDSIYEEESSPLQNEICVLHAYPLDNHFTY